MINDFGGPSKVKIKVPASQTRRNGEGDNDVVKVTASPERIQDILQGIQRIVDAVYVGGHEAMMVDEVEEDIEIVEEVFTIPKSDAGRFLDRGGKEMEAKWCVKVWVVDSEDGCIVRVVGLDSKTVAGAKNECMNRLRVKENVEIGEDMLDIINGGERGAELNTLNEFVKKISGDCSVGIEVLGGVFVVKGERKNVDRAVKEVRKLPETIALYSHTIEMVVDFGYRAHIIGRSGTVINKIRNDTGCLVMILKTGNTNEDKIVIRGVLENCEKAYGIIEGIVRDQDVRREEEEEEIEVESVAIASLPTVVTTRSVPGWSQPISARIPITSVSPSVVVMSPTVLLTEEMPPSPVVEDSWQAISKKGKVVDAKPASETSGSSKKKKRKAAKNISNVDVGTEGKIDEGKAVFNIGSNGSRSPASEVDSGHVGEGAEKEFLLPKEKSFAQNTEKKVEKKTEKKDSKLAPPKGRSASRSKSPERPVSPIRHNPIPVSPPADEWQTVKKGSGAMVNVKSHDSVVRLSSQSVNAAAVALGMGGDSEGKKKRKKKKKKGVDGSVSAEVDQ
jgi:hypothetical protein